MQLRILADKPSLGTFMAKEGAKLIRQAIAADGHANIIVATGASQFELLEALVQEPDLDWSKVTALRRFWRLPPWPSLFGGSNAVPNTSGSNCLRYGSSSATSAGPGMPVEASSEFSNTLPVRP